MPAIRHRRRTASPLVGALLPALATTLALAPAAARANDRDPRATPVPASACVEHARVGSFPSWSPDGFLLSQGASGFLVVHCPLPINAIDLSGTTNDNDLSKIRVHYHDPDGFGFNNTIYIKLVKTTPASPGLYTTVCEWNSNVDGTGSTTAASATKACPHDIASASFYHFHVSMSNHYTRFFGIEFPQ